MYAQEEYTWAMESNDYEVLRYDQEGFTDASAPIMHYKTLETYKHTMNVAPLIQGGMNYVMREKLRRSTLNCAPKAKVQYCDS